MSTEVVVPLLPLRSNTFGQPLTFCSPRTSPRTELLHSGSRDCLDSSRQATLLRTASGNSFPSSRRTPRQGLSSRTSSVMANSDVLFFAAFTGKLQVVQELLENGVDKDVVDNNNQTALYKASTNGHANVAMALILAGANVHVVENENLSTALHSAAAGGYTTIAHSLCKRGAKLEVEDRDGQTPLLVAANNGCLQVAQYLVSAGANTNARDGLDRTPAMLAKQYGFDKLAKFLMAHGSIVDPDFSPIARKVSWYVGSKCRSIEEDTESTQSALTDSDDEEASDPEQK